MTDETQQQFKVTDQSAEQKTLKTPETVKQDGVISEQINQLAHETAHAIAHANDMRPSDPSLIAAKDGETLEEYKARVAAIQSNAFGLTGDLNAEDTGKKTSKRKQLEYFEYSANGAQVAQSAKSDQILIASNITPHAPTVEPMQQLQDVKTYPSSPDAESLLVKNIGDVARESYQGVRHDGLGKGIVRVAQPPNFDGNELTEGVLRAGDSVKNAYKYNVEHPYRGREIENLNKISPEAWKAAFIAFPELQSIGGLNEKDASCLMKAIVANELEHYDGMDKVEDYGASIAPDKVAGLTIGFPQMTAVGIQHESLELEKQVAEGKREFNPLARYAHAPIFNVVKALEDPQNAPLFVAANIAHNARMYEQNKYPITMMTLGYGFNPDLPDPTGKHKHNMLPKIQELATSLHAKNIERWLSTFN